MQNLIEIARVPEQNIDLVFPLIEAGYPEGSVVALEANKGWFSIYFNDEEV